MNLFESIRVALVALRTNKMRSLLTMLGIIIGTGAVIGMLAIGNGFQQYLDSQFDQLGIGSFYVFAGADSKKVSDQQAPQLTFADAEALMQPGAMPAADGVTVELGRDAQLLYTSAQAARGRALLQCGRRARQRPRGAAGRQGGRTTVRQPRRRD